MLTALPAVTKKGTPVLRSTGPFLLGVHMLVRSFRALLAFGIATCSAILTAQTLSGTTPLQYTALQIPCRAVDTRVTGGPIAAGTSQSFYPAGGACNIPLPTSGVGLLAAAYIDVAIVRIPNEAMGSSLQLTIKLIKNKIR
jgi:hypothetical protein